MGLISFLVSPTGFVLSNLMLGFIAWSYRRTRSLGSLLLALGSLALLILSTGPVSSALLNPLEFKYAAYGQKASDPDAGFIVVMAGYAVDVDYYPLSSKVNSSALFRLVEAHQIWNRDRAKRVVVTGHADVPGMMAELLAALGVAPESIMMENQSNNSFESARNVKEIVGENRFVLVTSAGHMPRSMAIFKKLGMKPIPAPTDFLASRNPFDAGFLPSAEYLHYSELAFHEYVGMAWYWLRGRI